MTPAAPFRSDGERGRGTLRLPASLIAALLLCGMALGAAALWSGFEPRGGSLRPQGIIDIWLLTSFVLGVLLLLFGASARLGGLRRRPGAREGLAALRERANALERGETMAAGTDADSAREEGTGDAASAIMATGGWVLLLYAVVWLVGGG